MKKILVLGATGAMGSYVVPKLLKMGYAVDAVSLDAMQSSNDKLRYFQADAKDDAFLTEILKNEYDGIVDFMIYAPAVFAGRMETMLKNTDHYIYLSSYRVYSGEQVPITESCPRMLDVSKDEEYLANKDLEYSLYKAIGEDMLLASGYKNWTIVRPAITYSSRKFQLVTLEAPVFIRRMQEGKPIILPKEAMGVQATMSWGGDVAEMIVRLLFNERAKCEAYTVSTAEHQPWEEVAKCYQEIGGLQYKIVGVDEYMRVWGNNGTFTRYQLYYDRLYDRVVDNRKILDITGMKQSELMPLKKGLAMELSTLPKHYDWGKTIYDEMYVRMGRYFNE